MSMVRRRRLESGLTQSQLAEMAGVSRQLVAAVEAGRHVPGVDAALRLAASLGSSAEELFAPRQEEVSPVLGGGLTDGAMLRLGLVGERTVAYELPERGAMGAGWGKPDAVWRESRLMRLPACAPAGAVVAGCEPALGLAERLLDGLGQRSLLSVPASTGRALGALARGNVHAAVVHGPPGGLPSAPEQATRVHLARWRVGLGVPVGARLASLEAALRAPIPIVQRDPAAASQQAFERARDSLEPQRPSEAIPRPKATARAAPVAPGHLEAARLAAALGGAAVTNEAAARALGLAFIALEEHAVELWVDRRWLELPGVVALLELLGSAGFTRRVAELGGYDLTGCGVPV